jgi:hypothetical protein
MLEIFLCSCIYLNKQKHYVLLSLMLYLQQNLRTSGQNRFCPEAGRERLVELGGGGRRGYGPVNIYTYR